MIYLFIIIVSKYKPRHHFTSFSAVSEQFLDCEESYYIY